MRAVSCALHPISWSGVASQFDGILCVHIHYSWRCGSNCPLLIDDSQENFKSFSNRINWNIVTRSGCCVVNNNIQLFRPSRLDRE